MSLYFQMLFFVFTFLQSSGEKRTNIISDYRTEINNAGKLFNISPRLIASVIFVEQVRNVTWVDRDVDPLLAEYGLNVSLGIGQMKINTAIWIENAINDSTSNYFLGKNYSKFIPRSGSRDQVVKRLLIPEWNIKYIAANLAMINYRWEKFSLDIDNRVDILATLYSAGVVTDDGVEKRSPHANPASNQFGKMAFEYFRSEIDEEIVK